MISGLAWTWFPRYLDCLGLYQKVAYSPRSIVLGVAACEYWGGVAGGPPNPLESQHKLLRAGIVVLFR